MGAMYGTAPIPMLAIKGAFTLSNGMYCVCGPTPDGISVDVYKDKSRKELVSMQHGIIMSNADDPYSRESMEGLAALMESMIDEF